MKKCIYAFALASIFCGTLEGARIQEEMSSEQFEAAGLDKLTPEELNYLSSWLYGKVDEEKDKAIASIIPEGEDRFGADETIRKNVERIRPESKELTSSISGSFRGWDGKTVFRLDNGQVWRQVEKAKFSVNLKDPTITIEKGLFGTYFLSVKGFGSRVKVERIQ